MFVSVFQCAYLTEHLSEKPPSENKQPKYDKHKTTSSAIFFGRRQGLAEFEIVGLDDLLGGHLFWRLCKLKLFLFSLLLFRRELFKRVRCSLGENSTHLFLRLSTKISLCIGGCFPGSGRCDAEPVRIYNC